VISCELQEWQRLLASVLLHAPEKAIPVSGAMCGLYLRHHNVSPFLDD
jgi:hypothetical protein